MTSSVFVEIFTYILIVVLGLGLLAVISRLFTGLFKS